MKKLTLNKQTIARLNNPDQIYGGDREKSERYTNCFACGITVAVKDESAMGSAILCLTG